MPAVARAEQRLAELWVALNSAAPGRWQELGVTPGQLRLLLELAALERARSTQLAERMGIHVSTLSGIVDRLEERGLVRRTQAADDRRCWDLTLTDDGRARLRELFGGSCEPLRGSLAALGPRRVGHLDRLLSALLANLATAPLPGQDIGRRAEPSQGEARSARRSACCPR